MGEGAGRCCPAAGPWAAGRRTACSDWVAGSGSRITHEVPGAPGTLWSLEGVHHDSLEWLLKDSCRNTGRGRGREPYLCSVPKEAGGAQKTNGGAAGGARCPPCMSSRQAA